MVLTEQHSRHTSPDGKTEELSGKAGEVRFIDAESITLRT
jgi:hypothetical protein